MFGCNSRIRDLMQQGIVDVIEVTVMWKEIHPKAKICIGYENVRPQDTRSFTTISIRNCSWRFMQELDLAYHMERIGATWHATYST